MIRCASYHSAARSAPGPGEVHLWISDHDVVDLSVARACLDEADWAYLSRFQLIADRNRAMLRRTMRRLILGSYLGLPPKAIRFRSSPFGKPSLDGGQMARMVAPGGGEMAIAADAIAFNMTGSGVFTGVAVSAGQPIGLDIEVPRPFPDLLDIARSHFHPDEISDIAGSGSASERTDAFYRCWTRKEAYLKATGSGLTTPLDSFRVALGPAGRVMPWGGSRAGASWWITDISRLPSFYGALCTLRSDLQVETYRWPF